MNEWFTDQNEKYEHYFCVHVGNRIKIYLRNTETDEDYSLDLTQDDFNELLKLMKEWQSNCYFPSKFFQGNTRQKGERQ